MWLIGWKLILLKDFFNMNYIASFYKNNIIIDEIDINNLTDGESEIYCMNHCEKLKRKYKCNSITYLKLNSELVD